MCTSDSFLRMPSIVAFLLFLLASDSFCQTQVGLHTFWRSDGQNNWSGGPGTDPGWAPAGQGMSPTISVPSNGSVHFAFANRSDSNNRKSVTVEFKVNNANHLFYLRLGAINGFQDSTTNMMTPKTSGQRLPRYGLNPPRLQVNAYYDPQPEWETIELKNTTNFNIDVSVMSADSNCNRRSKSTGANGVQDGRVLFENNMFCADTQFADSTQITEIFIFPHFVDVDFGLADTEIHAPPHTGTWLSEIVFVDPYGNPMPHGGIRWTTDGPGLAAGETHNLAFNMLGVADSTYTLFGFDSSAADFQRVVIDHEDLPWHEGFEDHEIDSGVIDWRHWQGWDDDPVFDAPVSADQANGGDASLKIEGNADVIKNYEGADTGRWRFEAWQYIPSDFVSGGSGQFRGTHFILLNTYNHGGPYNWSADLQFDSVSGLMKVYHGAGADTVDVPYDTDRWVKIELIIDQDDDWTRVYYDDQFVTEYSWTGGILGNANGAADIAAVDLFANGSSPVFYDDLVLEPAYDFAPLLGDINLDGVINLLDVYPFIDLLSNGTYQLEADMNSDGSVNLLDVDAFIDALSN